MATNEGEERGAKEETSKSQEGSSGKKTRIPKRYLVALLGALGLVPTIGSRKSFALILTHISATNSSIAARDIFLSGVSTQELQLT